MKPRVYIETTIPSYLTARPSNEHIRVAKQELTRQWWDTTREHFDLVIAQVVIDECSDGDAESARARLDAIDGFPLIETTEDVGRLTSLLIAGVPFPPKAEVDALHIAHAAVHSVDYLLTWNCTHLANAFLRKRVEAICAAEGYNAPIICTPDELLFGGSK